MDSPVVKFVSVFRAINGRYESGTFNGVSDDQLKERGIFCDNLSFEQSKEGFLSGGFIEKGEHVVGLPIFTSRVQTEEYLKSKAYLQPPAIVQADIPLEFFIGEHPRLALVNNNWYDPELDRFVTTEELDRLSKGEHLPIGECVLRGVFGESLDLKNTGGIPKDLVEEIRKRERFFRPQQLKEGRLPRDTLFDEVRINIEPNEGSAEISVK